MRAAGHRAGRCANVLRCIGLASVLGVGAVGLFSGYASAASTGGSYGGGGPQGTPPGSFTVLTSQTVAKTGGTVTGTHGGQKVTITIPATDFSTRVQVTILVGTVSSIQNAVVSFEVSFAIGGTTVSGTFSKPVVMTITDSAIKAGYIVEEWDVSSWVTYSHATVSSGSATITVTTDPAFAVASALSTTTTTTTTTTTAHTDSTSATVTATSAETGVPVLGLALGSGGLVAGGVASLLLARRRRQSATRP